MEKDQKKDEQKDPATNTSVVLTTQNNSTTLEKDKKKVRKYTYLNQKVNIPASYGERMQYIRNMFYDEDLPYTISRAPSNFSHNCMDLGKYFKKELQTIVEIAGAILSYLSKTIQIDLKLQKDKKFVQSLDPDEILKHGTVSNSESLCILYKELCNCAGVKMEIISGMIKRDDYKVGDSLYKHKWCYLEAGGKIYFIDPLLAIGDIKEDDKFESNLKLFYFLCPTKYFHENHRPDDDKFQEVIKPINVKEFTKRPLNNIELFYHEIYELNIRELNHYEPEFKWSDEDLVIKFIVEMMDIKVKATINGKNIPDDNIKYINTNMKDNFEIKVTFPSNGDYRVSVLGKNVTSGETHHELFAYKINVKIVKKEEKKNISIIKNLSTHIRLSSPQNRNKSKSQERRLNKSASDFDEKIKKKCFDNKGAHLYEPRNHFLRIGFDTKFKVRIKDAKNVVVLDGRKWNFLHRKEEDLYEGTIKIKSENVVICAMRGSNMYTEVFEFFANKR